MTQPPISFATFMEQALYGPDGYYSSGRAKSGRSGDYYTAPDTGPVFGTLLATLFKSWATAHPFFNHIVEVGAGEGALAQAIRASLPNDISYTALDRSPIRQEKLKALEGIHVASDLSTLRQTPISGCLLANELIDAFPVHRVRMHQGQLQEGYVEKGKWSWFAPSTPKLHAYLDRLHLHLPDGYETEINLAMSEWVRDAASILSKGLVVIIDYGRPARELYDEERRGGTLRVFRQHRVSRDWLATPGHADLTADVDFTSLALDGKEVGLVPLAFMDLSSFLLPAMALKSEWSETDRPSLRALFHPEGLGGAFHVLIFEKGMAGARHLFQHNRLSRLGL